MGETCPRKNGLSRDVYGRALTCTCGYHPACLCSIGGDCSKCGIPSFGIQNPPGMQLYTQTSTLKKGGVELKVYRCARGSTSLESFHLHLNRFIPGTSASALHFQIYLLEALSRWNANRAAQALRQALSMRSYDLRLHSSSQRVFVPDRKESGVVIGANETPTSIMVQVGNRVIRRNRHDLRVLPTALNLPVSEEDSSGSPVPATSSQSSVPFAVFSHTSEGVPGDMSPRAPRHVPPRSAPVVPQPVASSPSVQAHQEPDPVASTPTASSGVHTKCGRLVRPPSKLNL
ncbi:hypothetical protein CAPTEDRAFT_211989 [Capitella teleta]|uniref:Uncharacterized protein n=1 Tax=Capitella teleta TaxID=283909 RepID=R7TAX3_CAPTE|nr:hypothetical protein CAPTEDRAFT_211989 [Capitella teleta]|eukprot:ELT88144.1 hypothetical protein CAPTEDRAFT_211989 [Capitella teleta]